MYTLKDYLIFGHHTPLLSLIPVAFLQEKPDLNPEENEVMVRYLSADKIQTLILRNPSGKQIVQAINAVKSLHTLTAPPTQIRALSNPSDVPGTLLNMALLNLGSENDLLRVAAYNLLDAICTNFNYGESKSQLLGTEGKTGLMFSGWG